MGWPELLKAKENLRNIEHQLNLLHKSHNAFTKRDVARNTQVLLDQIDESLVIINKEIDELSSSMQRHRKYVESKSVFLKRHYSRAK